MKKILIYAPTASSSGITQYILNFLNRADLDAFHFDILSYQNERLEKWANEHGSKYYNLTVSLYKHPLKYKKFLMRVFGDGYDAIHFHASTISTARPFKYAKKCGVQKLILHSHAVSIESASKLRKAVFTVIHKMLRAPVAKIITRHCACSNAAADWMFGPKYTKRAVIMKNAVDFKLFSYHQTFREQIREQFNIQTPYIIGHVGRFAEVKNHRFILDVFNFICSKRNDCTLMLIGEGSLKNSMVAYAKQLGIENRVLFVPFCEDVYKYYSAMDLFLLPSLFEALPITLVEAQVSGLPIIVSNRVSAISDITKTLTFIPLEESIEVWAEEISKKLDAKNRYENTEKLVSDGFSLEEQITEIQNLYLD